MPGPLSIQYTNFSRIELSRASGYYGGATNAGVDSFSEKPGATLPARGGSATLTVDESILGVVMKAGTWVMLGWSTPSGYYFGVKIVVPVQVLTMGYRPYYEVASGGSKPKWERPHKDPADPYTFPSGKAVSVDVSPKSGHQSLILKVSVND